MLLVLAACATTPAVPRTVEDDLVAHAHDVFPVDRVDDMTPAEPWRLNLYQDAGHTQVNRGRVDLDRDGSWDWKVTFAADTIYRERALGPENWAPKERWTGSSWEPAP